MQSPPRPPDEEYRLEALRALALLDTRPEPEFDDIVRLGRRLFGTEISLVTLLDADRQWFKARSGLDAPETPRDISFCGHAILGRQPFVVLDAAKDERFHDNPLVTGPPHIRFYAGMPLRIPSGYNIGTMCVISPAPRAEFSEEEKSLLGILANLVMNVITIAALRRAKDDILKLHEQYLTLTQIAETPMATVSHDGTVETCNEAFTRLCGMPAEGQAITSLLDLGREWKSDIAAAKELSVFSRHDRSAPVMVHTYHDGYLVVG